MKVRTMPLWTISFSMIFLQIDNTGFYHGNHEPLSFWLQLGCGLMLCSMDICRDFREAFVQWPMFDFVWIQTFSRNRKQRVLINRTTSVDWSGEWDTSRVYVRILAFIDVSKWFPGSWFVCCLLLTLNCFRCEEQWWYRLIDEDFYVEKMVPTYIWYHYNDEE